MNRGIRVVQKPHEPQAAGTLRRASVHFPFFESRVAEDALFGFSGDLVEVNLLIRTGSDAVAIAFAALLIKYDDAIFLTFVDGLARASCKACGVCAVITDARQIEVEVVIAV